MEVAQKQIRIHPYETVDIILNYLRKDKVNSLVLFEDLDKQQQLQVNINNDIEVMLRNGNDIKNVTLSGAGEIIRRKINRLLKENNVTDIKLITSTLGRSIYAIIKLHLIKLTKNNEKAREIVKLAYNINN